MHAKIIKEMQQIRKLVEEVHAERKIKGIKLRQPLGALYINGQKWMTEYEDLLKSELNIKKIFHHIPIGFIKNIKNGFYLDPTLTSQLITEGKARDLIRDIQDARKAVGCRLDELATVELPSWPSDFENYIKTQTLTTKLVKGENLKIIRV